MELANYTGRPSKNVEFKLYDGPLYKVLLEKLPSEYVKFGRIDTLAISTATGNARFTVYRWLNEQILSRKAIRALLKLSQEANDTKEQGALTKEDLIPFVGL